MANKILLALDNSNNSLKAVKFVAKSIKPDARITMLSVLPDPTAACELDGPSLIPIFKQNIKTFCTIEEAKKSAVQGFMNEAKKLLIRAGFAAKNISIRVRKRKSGISRDVLKEAAKGKYDTVVLGRRGLTGIKQFVAGSVTRKVFEASTKATLIIVE